ncbi:DUF5309 domain-containing protein [Alphaproteobacteria bacterium]|nr:DUF5309 domain-containing protein [Alphaproteobacteria bacterium]
MAGINGLRGTGQFGTDFRPTNYRELYTLLEPNGTAPLNALLSMGSSQSSDDPKFNNFRDELPDRKLKVNGALNASATTIQLDTGDAGVPFVVAGSIIVNSATGEVMRATAAGDTTNHRVTVARQIGGGSLTIADDSELFIAGYSATEGDTAPDAISFDPTVAFNYCQIFRTAFEVSNTLKATYRRTGDAEDEYMTKALKMHMSDIERAMFFGKKVEESGSTAQPRRYTGGLMNELTNVLDQASNSSASVLSETGFDTLLSDTVFAFGSKQKIAFCGTTCANLLQQIGKARWQPTVVSGTYGINFTKYSTYAGDLLVHVHPQFRQIPGMANDMVIIDFPFLKYRFLDGRDTTLLQNRQTADKDAAKHEYLTECGLELMQDKVHTVIKNWNSLS